MVLTDVLPHARARDDAHALCNVKDAHDAQADAWLVSNCLSRVSSSGTCPAHDFNGGPDAIFPTATTARIFRAAAGA